MTVRMKALKPFKCEPEEGGHVRRGREFDCISQHRADEYERRGLAVPVAPMPTVQGKAALRPQNKMEPALQNKAAVSGPLPSPGGRIGEATQPSLSHQDQAPQMFPSTSPKAKRK